MEKDEVISSEQHFEVQPLFSLGISPVMGLPQFIDDHTIIYISGRVIVQKDLERGLIRQTAFTTNPGTVKIASISICHRYLVFADYVDKHTPPVLYIFNLAPPSAPRLLGTIKIPDARSIGTDVLSLEIDDDGQHVMCQMGASEYTMMSWRVEKEDSVLKRSAVVGSKVVQSSVCPFEKVGWLSTGDRLIKFWRVNDSSMREFVPVNCRKLSGNFTKHTWLSADIAVVAGEDGNIILIEDNFISSVIPAKAIWGRFFVDRTGISLISDGGEKTPKKDTASTVSATGEAEASSSSTPPPGFITVLQRWSEGIIVGTSDGLVTVFKIGQDETFKEPVVGGVSSGASEIGPNPSSKPGRTNEALEASAYGHGASKGRSSMVASQASGEPEAIKHKKGFSTSSTLVMPFLNYRPIPLTDCVALVRYKIPTALATCGTHTLLSTLCDDANTYVIDSPSIDNISVSPGSKVVCISTGDRQIYILRLDFIAEEMRDRAEKLGDAAKRKEEERLKTKKDIKRREKVKTERYPDPLGRDFHSTSKMSSSQAYNPPVIIQPIYDDIDNIIAACTRVVGGVVIRKKESAITSSSSFHERSNNISLYRRETEELLDDPDVKSLVQHGYMEDLEVTRRIFATLNDCLDAMSKHRGISIGDQCINLLTARVSMFHPICCSVTLDSGLEEWREIDGFEVKLAPKTALEEVESMLSRQKESDLMHQRPIEGDLEHEVATLVRGGRGSTLGLFHTIPAILPFDTVISVSVCNTTPLAAFITGEGVVTVFRYTDSAILCQKLISNQPKSLSFHPMGYLAIGSLSHCSVYSFVNTEAEGGGLLEIGRVSCSCSTRCLFNNGGNILAIATATNVSIVSFPSMLIQCVISPQSDPITDIAFSNDGQFIATVSVGGSLCVNRLPTGEKVAECSIKSTALFGCTWIPLPPHMGGISGINFEKAIMSAKEVDASIGLKSVNMLFSNIPFLVLGSDRKLRVVAGSCVVTELFLPDHVHKPTCVAVGGESIEDGFIVTGTDTGHLCIHRSPLSSASCSTILLHAAPVTDVRVVRGWIVVSVDKSGCVMVSQIHKRQPPPSTKSSARGSSRKLTASTSARSNGASVISEKADAKKDDPVSEFYRPQSYMSSNIPTSTHKTDESMALSTISLPTHPFSHSVSLWQGTLPSSPHFVTSLFNLIQTLVRLCARGLSELAERESSIVYSASKGITETKKELNQDLINLRQKLEDVKTDGTVVQTNHAQEIRNLKMKHAEEMQREKDEKCRALDQQERDWIKKEQELKDRLAEVMARVTHEQLVREELKESAKQHISEVESQFQESLSRVVKERDTIVDEYIGELSKTREESEEATKKLEQRLRGDISAVKLEERKTRSTTNILITQNRKLREEIYAKKMRICSLKQQLDSSKKKNLSDTAKVSQLSAQVKERDAALKKHEEELKRAREKISELRKVREVLDFRVQDLRREIAPRDQQLSDFKIQLSEVDAALVQAHKEGVIYQQKAQAIETRLAVTRSEMKSVQTDLNVIRKKYKDIMFELNRVAHLDSSKMPAELGELLRVYSDGEITKKVETRGKKEDALSEFQFQRHLLEKNVSFLKIRVSQSEEKAKRVSRLLVAQNADLLREINQLRSENKDLHLELAALKAREKKKVSRPSSKVRSRQSVSRSESFTMSPTSIERPSAFERLPQLMPSKVALDDAGETPDVGPPVSSKSMPGQGVPEAIPMYKHVYNQHPVMPRPALAALTRGRGRSSSSLGMLRGSGGRKSQQQVSSRASSQASGRISAQGGKYPVSPSSSSRALSQQAIGRGELMSIAQMAGDDFFPGRARLPVDPRDD
ncbi:hypothetical protein ADUPG1_001002 [Aduncisulcus paluster]|uniref:Cilia- and flagella-associated protein 43 n=1 Tax=Aduncisulcus paluster TaxID=2918883 RepID=A0ABQ5KCE9_9EUKA|nr:hypothetical protein ADUPG1_001002 [Aduncisulcus paluster]